jgi:hypothetical protein
MRRALRIRCAPACSRLPVTTVRFLERNWPASGGGYFRLLPYVDVALAAEAASTKRDVSRSTMFYFHPWEIDAEQPRIPGINARTRFRHYVNLQHTEGRLRRLLADFSWGRMDEVFLAAVGTGAGGKP